MKFKNILQVILGVGVLAISLNSYASDYTIPNTFTSGTPAVAADVNANFTAAKTAVDDNNSRITTNSGNISTNSNDLATLQAALTSLQNTVAQLQTDLTSTNNTIATLQGTVSGHTTTLATHNSSINTLQTGLSGKADVGHNHDASYAALNHNHDGVYATVLHGHAQGDITGLPTALNTYTNQISIINNDLNNHTSQISAINGSEIMALDPYFTIANDSRGPIATFTGINLQLVNGSGTTDGTPNGLGNLIIGYDEVRTDSIYFCSHGGYVSSASCGINSYTWAVSHKSGSHNLVIGRENNYSQYGGMVTGYRNTINNFYTSVSGGLYNTASGYASSISGGYRNNASGNYASVSGGEFNDASVGYASVSGGYGNNASGNYASISGGYNNTVNGTYASISGGFNNTAIGNRSSILGGSGEITEFADVSVTIPALP